MHPVCKKLHHAFRRKPVYDRNRYQYVEVMSLRVLVRITGGFQYTDGLCKAWVALDLFSCNNSCLHLSFATMDEYLRLKDPLRHGRLLGRCSLVTWLTAPWLIAGVQCLAQYTLSDADAHLVVDGLCLIRNRNFLIVGAIFSFAIPCVVTTLFYSLCHHEIKALKAGRYFDENGSLRNQYAHDEEELPDEDDDDDGEGVERRHCDDSSDSSTEVTSKVPPEIVQMSVVNYNGSGVAAETRAECVSETVTSFSAGTSTSCSMTFSNAMFNSNAAQQNSKNTPQHKFAVFVNESSGDCGSDLESQGQHNIAFDAAECSNDNDNQLQKENLKQLKSSTHVKFANSPDVEFDDVIMPAECPDECLRHEIDIARVLAVLIVCSLLTWAPLSLDYLLLALCSDGCLSDGGGTSMTQILALKWIAYSSIIAVPTLCVAFSEYARDAVRNIMTGRCRQQT